MVEPKVIDRIKENLTPNVEIASVSDTGDEIIAEVEFRYSGFLFGERGGETKIHTKKITVRANIEGNIISAYGL